VLDRWNRAPKQSQAPLQIASRHVGYSSSSTGWNETNCEVEWLCADGLGCGYNDVIHHPDSLPLGRLA
jgi:hypothetical protein